MTTAQFKQTLSASVYDYLGRIGEDQKWLAEKLGGSLGWANGCIVHGGKGMTESFIRKLSRVFPEEFGYAYMEFRTYADATMVAPGGVSFDVRAMGNELRKILTAADTTAAAARAAIERLDSMSGTKPAPEKQGPKGTTSGTRSRR